MKDEDRPAEISCWTWYDKQHHADLDLWQLCLKTAHWAGAKDVHATAEKKYDYLGGTRLSGLTRRDRKRNRSKK